MGNAAAMFMLQRAATPAEQHHANTSQGQKPIASARARRKFFIAEHTPDTQTFVRSPLDRYVVGPKLRRKHQQAAGLYQERAIRERRIGRLSVKRGRQRGSAQQKGRCGGDSPPNRPWNQSSCPLNASSAGVFTGCRFLLARSGGFLRLRLVGGHDKQRLLVGGAVAASSRSGGSFRRGRRFRSRCRFRVNLLFLLLAPLAK
jgi:hypothetical protein